MLFLSGFLFAIESIGTTNHLPLHSTRLSMKNCLPRPSSTASFATSLSSTTTSQADDDNSSKMRNKKKPRIDNGKKNITTKKPRILCLHGKFQSGSSFSNKIGGARRKFAREYELDFLDGPIILPDEGDDTNANADNENTANDDTSLAPRSWWVKSEDGKHTLIREAIDYVIQQTEIETYDAIIGFSQGGTMATALSLSGALPNVRAVVTAGAPYVAEAFNVALELSKSNSSTLTEGCDVPKLHFAGERDNLVTVDSMRELCEKGGNGKFILHDQGHLFPTRSARVKEVLDFLEMALSEK
mmetsp:Transcript_25962/g.54163  ORF Transcript_25962/g.54163 Transcript_25962/m.54163 type:complete len:300 (+) Transcript_25962:37-936(+)